MKPENLSGRFSEEWIRLMDDKIPEGEYAVASLIQESCGFYQEQKLRHYCIAASDELIDIVSTFEPEIEAGILEKK